MVDNIRVLHVDDEPDIAEMTREFLQREGGRIDIVTETSASEGMDRLARDDFDCVVSDYDMPGQNGIEFLESVREEYPNLPFILYAGKGSEEVASDAISAGVTDYFQKGGGTDQYELLANEIVEFVEKYRSEQELDQLRRQFTKVVEQNFVGIYIIQDREFTYVNPRLADIHGYDDPAEVIGKSPFDLVAPDERERVQSNLDQRMSGEVSVMQYQTTGLTKDGDFIDIELHERRIELDGKPAVIGAEADITKQKQRERNLEQFKNAVEQTGHAVYMADSDGTIEYVNPAFVEITGYTADEAVGRNLRILKSGEMPEKYYEELWETLLERNICKEKIVNRRQNGEKYYAQQTIAPISGENDDIDGFVAIQTDITDRKKERARLEFLETLENELTELSIDFLQTEQQNIDVLIDDALEKLGSLVEADRSYVFQIDHDTDTLSNTHEWCAESVEPQIDMLQDLPLDTFPWWMEKLKDFESINIPNVSEVPPEAEAERDILQEQNIESLIVTPMISDNELVGFIGFDWLEEQDAWSEDFIDILRMASELITTARTQEARKRQTQQLKERLELAITGAELGVWDWDMTTDEVEFNEQWAATLGYSLDELESHLNTWEKRVHPDDLEAVRDALDAHIEGETDYYDTEHRMRTADGDWKWVRDVGKIFERDDDGEPTRAVGIHIDIDERKRHEQQLSALHGANRRLIDADSRAEVADIAVEAAHNLLEFSVPSMWYTANGEIEMVANSEEHQKFLDEVGMTEPTHPLDSWLGDVMESGETTVRSPLPPEDLAADVPLHSAIILPLGEEGSLACAAKGEVEFTDRQVRIAEILARNVQAALDQLDQRRALERHQEFTDNLLDAIKDVVYVLDTNGDLIEWNRAFEEVTGYGGDQIESMNATEFFSDGDVEAIADAVAETFEADRTRVEADILTADDESIPYEFVANSFEDPDGEPVIAGIGRDRSLHVEYERTLEEQRNNLEVLNQVVRHDIRNDMTVIQGRAELLKDHVDEAGQEELASVLDSTKSAIELTKTARNLAETMLSSEEDVEPVRLDEHLRDPIENVRSEFEDVVFTSDNFPDIRVRGNELLEAVFRNLIQNAVIHNDKQKPEVRITTRVDEETATVCVADNGPGIPDHQKETIFGKGETGLESPGTGIGLYLVRTLVDQYGGEVWVEDNCPEGSVFVVELPIAE